MTDMDTRRTTIISIVLIALVFFVIGFVSWLNSILIPYFKIACELNNFQSYLVAFAFYIAYLVMSVPSGLLLKKVGFKRGIMIAFFFLAAGALVFIPAALTRTYGIFLTGLFTMGTGMSIMQTAANPYITIIGPIERAAQRISIMGICNKFAGIISPLIFAAVVLKATDSDLFASLTNMDETAKKIALDELIRRVITPYSILSVFLVAFGLLIRFSVLPEINTEDESREVAESHAGKTSVVQFPYLILGAVAIFAHCGTQIISIDTIISYASSYGLDLLEAKAFPSFVLSATIIGYVMGVICMPKLISQTNALRVCTITGLILSCCIIFCHGSVTFFGHSVDISVWFVASLGLSNSLVYAGIWPLAIHDLGRFTKTGSSLLVMGLVGNALFPLAYGKFADVMGDRQAYWLLIPLYVYLVFYAVHGHKIIKWTKGSTE